MYHSVSQSLRPCVFNRICNTYSALHCTALYYSAQEDLTKAVVTTKVFVSPISVSTGLNTKNLLALSRGLPLVTTPLGAEGLLYTPGPGEAGRQERGQGEGERGRGTLRLVCICGVLTLCVLANYLLT